MQLGDMITSLVEVAILLDVGGIHVSIVSLAQAIAIALLLSFCLTSLQETQEGIVDHHASMFWDSYRWSSGSFSFLFRGQQTTLYKKK